MKKRAADMASPAAGVADRSSLRVGQIEEPFIGTGRGQRRIVEFMSAYHAAGSPERTVSEKPRFPIAEMQLAHRKACGMSKEAYHRMACRLRVRQAFAEHHVAAALAVHRAGRSKSPQPLLETMSVCQQARV